MKIFETLERDPRSYTLPNDGQARVDHLAELQGELATFVCEQQYQDAIQRILQSYLEQVSAQKRQQSAWVSGFYGSGKSHLLKMLGHLWVNTSFADGSTARQLVPNLPQNLRASFLELDNLARRLRTRTFKIVGTLPSGTGSHVRADLLRIVLRECGLPEEYERARFQIWLADEGVLADVQRRVGEAGKEWRRELQDLYVSPVLARAVMQARPNLFDTEASALEAIRTQFPPPTADIATEDFLALVRRALELVAGGPSLPLTILVVDEVQQYIGRDPVRASTVTEVAEAIQTKLDGRVMLVAAGQAALARGGDLQKLVDRFRLAIQLTDADVENVTRQVLLSKRPSAQTTIQQMLTANGGEIAKHLQGTKLAERPSDRESLVADYPLLPTRRRFWEECLRAVDTQGGKSALRSQLRILNEALRGIAEQDVGHVVLADTMFTMLSPDLVNTGVLDHDTSLKIAQLAKEPGGEEGDGPLRARLLGLVFLVGKLPRDPGFDLGVRATPTMLADLLIADVSRDSGPFRERVQRALHEMAASGLLLQVGDEYRVQTPEGAEWDRAYRAKVEVLQGDAVKMASRRTEEFASYLREALARLPKHQGAAKVPRHMEVHDREDPPALEGRVVIWVRDGWSVAERDVLAEARARGQDDPVIHVFLPRTADDLSLRLAELAAAKEVLVDKGEPSSAAGSEAYTAMKSRQAAAESRLRQTVRQVWQEARVFQSGGVEVVGADLGAKLQVAREASLKRLFPRFAEGDHAQWPAVLDRLRHGADGAFQVVGWTGPVDKHPVGREVLAAVGAGRTGSEIRRLLTAPPFGWPQDAVDAGLQALTRGGFLRAEYGGRPTSAGALNQSNMSHTTFRLERIQLTTIQRVRLRSLFHEAEIPAEPDREEMGAAQFLDKVAALVQRAGGDPPLPSVNSARVAMLDELRHRSGTEQLAAILDTETDLRQAIGEARALAARRPQREEAWNQLNRLAAHARNLPIWEAVWPDIEAIRRERRLLADPDPVVPLQAKLAQALRVAVSEARRELEAAVSQATQELNQDARWRALAPDEQARILQTQGLGLPESRSVGTDADLVAELDRQSLAARTDAVLSVTRRASEALLASAKRSQPDAARVAIRRATLATPEEVAAWIREHEQRLMDAVRRGPIIIE